MLYDPKWQEKENIEVVEGWQKILLDAADLLEKHDWIQGDLQIGDGFCILGAMHKVTYGTLSERNRICAADVSLNYTKAFNRLVRHLHVSPATWNDKTARTKDEVISKLKEVAHAV